MAFSTLPKAADVVAMSITMGGSSRAGKATAIGLVPSRRCAPHSGATMLVVFVMAKPIRSRLSASSG